MIVVTDSGPFIHLSMCGCVQVLPALFGEVLAPPVVWEEVVELGAGRIGSDREALSPWLSMRPSPQATPIRSLLQAALDRGEVDAILLAYELHADRLLVDDLQARLAAQRLGVPVVGTLGLLLLAKAQGLLPEVRRPIEAMRQGGFWIAEAVVVKVLRQAGE